MPQITIINDIIFRDKKILRDLPFSGPRCGKRKGSESVGEVCIGVGGCRERGQGSGEKRESSEQERARQSHRYAYSANVQDVFTTVLPRFC